jgi:Protein of unknown function (DUF3987)
MLLGRLQNLRPSIFTDTNKRPTTYQGTLAKLPRALAPLLERPQWCLWRWTQLPGGKWQKPPFMATQPSRHASTKDASTWADYTSTLAAVQAGHGDGISYILTEADPYAAIDLDHCRHVDTHSIDAWAQNFVEAGRSSYSEVTPSGAGCRIWGLADGAMLNRKFTLGIDGKDIAVELFRRTNKVLTITGYKLDSIRELTNIDKVIEWAVIWGERRKAAAAAPAPKTNGFNGSSNGSGYSVDEIEQIVRAGAPDGANRSNSFHAIVGHYLGCGWDVEQIVAHLRQFPEGIGARYIGEDRLVKEVFRSAGKYGVAVPATAQKAAVVTAAVLDEDDPELVPDEPEPQGKQPAQPIRQDCDPELEDDDLEDADGENDVDPEQSVVEPKPLPDGLASVMPFDSSFLPGALAPWVDDIAERLQCPPDYVAISAITALGSVIGRRVGIKPQAMTDWIEFANMWGGFIGPPGMLKSPAMQAALGPIHHLEAEAAKDNEVALQAYEANMDAFKLRKDVKVSLERSAQKAAAQGKSKIAVDYDLGGEPEEPVAVRYRTNDTTYEAVGELLVDNPTGLLIERDELVSLLSHLDREEQAVARGFYMSGWSGTQPYTFDRILRGHLHVEAVCLSILGSTQPARISSYVNRANLDGAGGDGLLQRFGLMVWPDNSAEWKNVDRYLNSEARDRAWSLFIQPHANFELSRREIGAIEMPPASTLRVLRWLIYGFCVFTLVTGAPAFARVLITVDKSTQQMSVSVDGVPRYRFAVSTGRAGYGTPNGTYHPQRLAASWFSKL